MKNNFKFVIYILIIVFFASVVWIKYDYEKENKIETTPVVDHFLEFINDNNIISSTFSCPAKNETIIYLDDKYLLTSLGDVYKVKYNSLFTNGHNCELLDSEIDFLDFYNSELLYDNEDNFFEIENNFEKYEDDLVKYYKEDLDNLNLVKDVFPYIYFYDVEAKSLELDSSFSSNKLLIDNKGNINIYTNYGYPTSFSLLESNDTEKIFDRVDYTGSILSIYRTNNNELLVKDKVKYLSSSMEVEENVYGIRVITTKGMYNEIMDNECNSNSCNTKLELDEDFSKYFNNIIYTNGKYVFIKDTPTTIYNIENYIKHKENV